MGKLGRILSPVYPFLFVMTLYGCSAIHQQIVAAVRQPGDRLATTPETVLKESNCAKRERPFMRFESLEILPERVKPGARVNYRVIYVMCPLKLSESIKTRVTRNMLFKGEQVALNVKDGFELKPGRWIVDSFFTLPPDSPMGVYALEVAFDTPNGYDQKQVRSFVVANEFYLSE
jgi:hypothetical protein